jgi:signal transduction histidine kinase
MDPERASVLIVDDTAANRLSLAAVLAPLGVRIVEARSGAEAIERASSEAFAVALLDVQMPGMDGFEVAKRLRETSAGVELPIVFLTAIHRDELYARRGYAVGAADYITKPFDPDVLKARVKAFVDLFQQRERLRAQQLGERTRERDAALERLSALLASEQAARREAEVANRAKDVFLAAVSHELRTPLTAILGWAMDARRRKPSPEIERALSRIERNARAQMRIVEDVLDIGRVVSGQFRLEVSAANVADAIEGAVVAVRPAAQAKEVTIFETLEAGLGTIAADPERLQQIVWNLLSNAIKFTPAGGQVEVRAARRDANILIQVIDDGQGIGPDLMPHLFEMFRQADTSPSRRHGGLGLGLAIARQLVQAHGGRIEAHSDGEGKGSTFTVEIPAAPPPAAPSERPSRAPVQADRLDGIRLLLVEDDEDARELLERVLVDQGASVAVASSAPEGLRLLASYRPDVLLSDIAMPGVSGYTFIRMIRSLPPERGGRVPAVALTAYTRREDEERALQAGFEAHVSKPIEPDRLVSTLAELARTPRAGDESAHVADGNGRAPIT